MRQLIDPRLRRRVAGAFPSRATFKTVNFKTDSSFQKIRTDTTVISELSNIPCALGSFIESRPTDEERREFGISGTVSRRYLKLSYYCPNLDTEPRMAVEVDGVEYQIWGIEQDTRLLFTRLKLVVIKP